MSESPLKVCNTCGGEKALPEFCRDSHQPDGRARRCKKCTNEYRQRLMDRPGERDRHRTRCREWGRANPDKVSACNKKRYARNPEYARARTKEYRRRFPNAKRAQDLRSKYGISLDDYEALLANQGGGCAICAIPPASNKRLVVDHDHVTGAVRGLLCDKHNRAIGLLSDDPNLLIKAAVYLIGSDADSLIAARHYLKLRAA